MAQLIVAVGLTILAVVFSMSNTHHVELGWVVGEPIRIRLIFLLGIAFVAGSVTTVLYQLIGRVMHQTQLRSRQRAAAIMRAKTREGAR